MCHQNCQGAQAWTCHSKTSMDILNNQSCKTAPCSMYKRTYHNKISMDILNNQSRKTAALLTYKRTCHSKTFMDILNSQSYKTAPCLMYMRTCHSKRSMDILNNQSHKTAACSMYMRTCHSKTFMDISTNHVRKRRTTTLLLYIRVSRVPTTSGLLFKRQAALYPRADLPAPNSVAIKVTRITELLSHKVICADTLETYHFILQVMTFGSTKCRN